MGTDPAAACVMEMGRIQMPLCKGNKNELLFGSARSCKGMPCWAGRCLWFSGRDAEVRDLLMVSEMSLLEETLCLSFLSLTQG